ncbi:hypothetical protein GCM10018781_37970 [Kitasatospora indigofera]|uniref:Uncharacterized protein n=1 Tax=Kitasatospora indigofera TaxID=67307 RepID=A0A919KUE4_9ACTN|nr:hypothetical protein GCM10018781_37970 [Kitasatospora indigofera]
MTDRAGEAACAGEARKARARKRDRIADRPKRLKVVVGMTMEPRCRSRARAGPPGRTGQMTERAAGSGYA